MTTPTWGSVYWPWYLITASAAFLAAEVFALFTNSANTLSDFSWYELGITGTIGARHPAFYL